MVRHGELGRLKEGGQDKNVGSSVEGLVLLVS